MDDTEKNFFLNFFVIIVFYDDDVLFHDVLALSSEGVFLLERPSSTTLFPADELLFLVEQWTFSVLHIPSALRQQFQRASSTIRCTD